MILVLIPVAFLILVAVGLYWLRERYRLAYGSIELAFGVILLGVVVNSLSVAQSRACAPIIGGGIFCKPPEGALQLYPTVSAWIAVAAAVYIMVRGLDNFGEGLAQLSNPKWHTKWRQVFSRPTPRNTDAAQEHTAS
jgi:hypothetical protein